MKERTYLLGAGNTLFVEHSVIGVGLGAAPVALRNRFEYFPLDYQPPHFAMLTVAMEVGVVGGMFYLFLLIAPAVMFMFRWKIFIEKPQVLATFTLMLALFVVGLFDYYTWSYAPGRLWQWLAWGLFSAGLREMA